MNVSLYELGDKEKVVLSMLRYSKTILIEVNMLNNYIDILQKLKFYIV